MPKKKVKGSFTLRFHSPGSAECGDHEKACLTGTADGDLSGDVVVLLEPPQVVAGSARTVSAGTGTIEITRPDGVIRGAATGILDVATCEFHDVTAFVGGTGPYEDADGRIRSDGEVDLVSGVERLDYVGHLRSRA